MNDRVRKTLRNLYTTSKKVVALHPKGKELPEGMNLPVMEELQLWIETSLTLFQEEGDLLNAKLYYDMLEIVKVAKTEERLEKMLGIER